MIVCSCMHFVHDVHLSCQADTLSNAVMSLSRRTGRQEGQPTHLGRAVALEDLEQDSGAQAEGEAHHQAGTEHVQESGKDCKHCSALQLNVIAQRLHTNSAWLCRAYIEGSGFGAKV